MSKTQAERWGQLWSRYQNPDLPHKLLALDHMDELIAVGAKAGDQVDVAHFGSFA